MSNVPYTKHFDEVLGRCLIATRDIAPGEVIMRQKPLILGPKTITTPLCLGCHQRLDLQSKRYDCRKCLWPLCGEACESSSRHEAECSLFAKAKYRPCVKNDNSKQSAYSCITPLRALLLKQTHPNLFKSLMECQSHLDTHRNTQTYQILRVNLVPFFTGLLGLDTDETEVLTICSIFDTNCFEVRDGGGLVNVRGLYPTSYLLSHDCKHNTKHSFHGADLDLVLTATVPIKTGDLITTTYTQTLWGSLARREHLRASKHFECVCDRCRDPTEFGTYVGSVDCSECGDGSKIVSCDPLDPEADWECENCGFEVEGQEMIWGNEVLKNEIARMDKTGPEELEEFLERYQVLHPKNTFVLQVKYALAQMYGNIDGYRIRDLSEELVDRKISLCRDLLEVAEVLEPGRTRFRGLLLYDLYQAMKTKIERGEQALEDQAEKYLKEAVEILKTEPDLASLVVSNKNNNVL